MIEYLMNAYRHSKFHNAANGRILAKMLALYHSLLKKRTALKEINHVLFELDLSQVIDSSLFYSGTFEPKNEAIITRCLKPGMVALDIGANMGYHTFRMAQLVAPDGIVYAIEPMSWAVSKLKRHMQLNPHITNIRIDQLAFSDESPGIQELTFQSSYRLDNRQLHEAEKVRVMKLDDYVHENSIVRIDFIKLDVDGFEGKVIKGAHGCILNHHPVILFELNPGEIVKSGSAPEELFDFLTSSGYHLCNDDLILMEKKDLEALNHNLFQSSIILAFPGSLESLLAN